MPATAVAEERRTRIVRRVEPFDRIELRDPANWVDLVVEPGAPEEVVAEGPPAMLERALISVEGGTLCIRLSATLTERLHDALATSLTRQHLVYRVRAPRLLEVRVGGLARICADAFGADAPVITRIGPRLPVIPRPPAPPSR
jgi:hypothetical protein